MSFEPINNNSLIETGDRAQANTVATRVLTGTQKTQDATDTITPSSPNSN
jgi:hypothetical protein